MVEDVCRKLAFGLLLPRVVHNVDGLSGCCRKPSPGTAVRQHLGQNALTRGLCKTVQVLSLASSLTLTRHYNSTPVIHIRL